MIERRWSGETCVVAATGPSLDRSVADQCLEMRRERNIRIIAVNDAYKILPFADILYAADIAWWDLHDGAKDFEGERWGICHSDQSLSARIQRHGVRLAQGLAMPGFSLDPRYLHGCNSGFHAINLAILFGANPIILAGFNMQNVDGKSHFFGEHPAPLSRGSLYQTWVPFFDKAKEMLPDDIRIVNATPRSAIKCFERMPLSEALRLC